MLAKHSLGIGERDVSALYPDVDALEVNCKSHLVVIKRLGEIPQFLKSLEVVANDGNLLCGVLYEIVEFCYLHDNVLTRLLIRQLVEIVESLGNLYGSKSRLTVKRHLQLQTCR